MQKYTFFFDKDTDDGKKRCSVVIMHKETQTKMESGIPFIDSGCGICFFKENSYGVFLMISIILLLKENSYGVNNNNIDILSQDYK